MLVNISEYSAVWLSDHEVAVLKEIRAHGRILAKEISFTDMEAVTKLHKKSLLRRKNQEEVTYYQLRHGLPPLPF